MDESNLFDIYAIFAGQVWGTAPYIALIIVEMSIGHLSMSTFQVHSQLLIIANLNELVRYTRLSIMLSNNEYTSFSVKHPTPQRTIF